VPIIFLLISIPVSSIFLKKSVKYNAAGQLTCIVCDSIVRSDSAWAVHLNSKTHRENLSRRTKRKEPPDESAVPFKKPAVALPPPKPAPKSILKNSHEVRKPTALPSDFFQPQKNKEIPVSVTPSASTENMEVDEAEDETEDAENGSELPEGFFDDPKLDAKVRIFSKTLYG